MRCVFFFKFPEEMLAIQLLVWFQDTCSTSTAIPVIDALCRQLELLLRKNPSFWFVGHKVQNCISAKNTIQMTWADLMSSCLFNPIAYHMPHILESFPNLYLHTKRISELERLSGFLYHLKDIKV